MKQEKLCILVLLFLLAVINFLLGGEKKLSAIVAILIIIFAYLG